MITLAQLQLAMPDAGPRAALFVAALSDAIDEFQVDTLLERAVFIAQAAHESGSLRYTREIWGPTEAQRGYEGRLDLGNTHVGDGKLFLGRGIFQVTGRANTLRCLAALGRPDTDLEYLETPIGACRSAGWFWRDRGLAVSAQAGNFATNTKKLNGGFNGLDDRIKHYIRARRALGI